MLNYTRIPAPRVTLVDPQTGVVANEWFRFFNNLYTIAYAATGSVTPGTYGSATAVPQITVDDFGTITGISNVPIAIDASQIVSGTIASARISGSYTGITGVGTLTVGTWNATAITTPYGGTGLTSYTAGDTLYYASGTALTKLAIGASTFINTSSGTAPQWTDPSTITIGKATNLVGGAANRIAYQTATDTTGFIVAPTVSNTYLEWSGTAFQWSSNPLGTVTSVSVVSANGLAGTVATATTTPAITLSTTVTGLLKGNGTAISAASSGTDYAPATSGTSILYGNGAGGFSNVTIGTGISFAAGTLSATGTGGTVTSVSGTGSVNGITLTGTVTSSGSLTLGGTLSGIDNSQLTNSTISGVALGGNLFDLTAGTGVSFSVGTTYNGSAAITINATGTGGTVTSVAALTLGTTGTDLSSTVANGTTTPVITLNVPTASAANRGALSAADWTTFNNKGSGSVTSVAASVPSFLAISGSPITTSGTLAITLSGTALPTTSGGTGLTSFTSGGVVYASSTSALATSANLNFDGTKLGLGITPSGSWGTQSFTFGKSGASNPTYPYIASTTSQALSLGSNSYWDGTNWKAQFGGGGVTAMRQDIQFNQVAWFTAPAVTTGVTQTFTQAMTLFNSGGLSLGNTTDPGATNLSVTGTGKFGTTVGVGAATPSTSGAGITFPATQSASTNANTLDDYEEGSWTPADASGAVLTFTSITANYTKIGNVVNVFATLTYPATASAAQAKISGLPFNAGTFALSLLLSPGNTNATGQGWASAGTAIFSLYTQNGSVKTNANMSGSTVYLTGTYTV